MIARITSFNNNNKTFKKQNNSISFASKSIRVPATKKLTNSFYNPLDTLIAKVNLEFKKIARDNFMTQFKLDNNIKKGAKLSIPEQQEFNVQFNRMFSKEGFSLESNGIATTYTVSLKQGGLPLTNYKPSYAEVHRELKIKLESIIRKNLENLKEPFSQEKFDNLMHSYMTSRSTKFKMPSGLVPPEETKTSLLDNVFGKYFAALEKGRMNPPKNGELNGMDILQQAVENIKTMVFKN